MSTSYPDLNLTTFPEAVDTFVQMLDIVASDATNLAEYQSAMEAGNVIQANAALSNIANGTQKLLTAEKINKIFNSIEALERFLASDIVPYVTQLQANWQTEINKFIYKGNYSSSTSYVVNNIVSYTVGIYTYLYICIQAAKGKVPTNTTYWRQLTVKGLQGTSGTAMSFLYEWDAATSYVPQDCVSYGGKLWGCLTANSNSVPSATNNKWEELMSIAPTTYPVQSSQPASQEVGDLWFQVV